MAYGWVHCTQDLDGSSSSSYASCCWCCLFSSSILTSCNYNCLFALLRGDRLPESGNSTLRARLALRSKLRFVKFKIFFFAKIECGLYFLDRFDVLMSKIIFKKWKNIIGMYFGTKSYLKSNRYHTTKYTLKMWTSPTGKP